MIGAQINANEFISKEYTASIGDTTLKLNDFWGKKEFMYNLVVEHNK